MTQMANYLEDALLNHTFRGVSFTMPTDSVIALYTVTPTDGTAGTEVSTSGTAYARLTVTSNTTNWTAPGGTGIISNTGVLAWSTATAAWGTVAGVALFDQGGTNMLMYGDLGTPRAVITNDVFKFVIGALQLAFA